MKAIYIIGGILAVGVIAGLASTGSSGSSSDTEEPGDQKDMATVMCEEFVDRQLKAPGTADYGSLSEATVIFEDDVYTVDNYVDAENSFGAKLRSTFTCKVTYEGNDQWTLVSLTGL
jgi:hypothetical protein